MDIYFKPTDTRRCLPFSSSHPNQEKHTIYPSTENFYHTGKSTTEIKTVIRIKWKPKKYDYPVNIITNGVKKVQEILQNELGNQKKNKVWPFISKFNSNNPPVYNAIKNSLRVLKRNNVLGFESIKLINSKRQPLNLKKLVTKVEFSNDAVGVRKCQDLRCES